MDFGAGKAGAFDLVCITDDQKGMGVDFHDNLIQGSHFAAGNDGHQDGLIGHSFFREFYSCLPLEC